MQSKQSKGSICGKTRKPKVHVSGLGHRPKERASRCTGFPLEEADSNLGFRSAIDAMLVSAILGCRPMDQQHVAEHFLNFGCFEASR